jgi:hypothetical protein
MGIIASIGGQKVLLGRGLWRSADLALEARLNELTEAWIRETGGPPLDARDPERQVAEEMIRRLGGHLLHHLPARGQEAARRYFAHRQLRLFP